MRIRVSGLIVREGQVALVEFRDATKGVHYDLPGGGLEPTETLHEGVRRECREEIGCEVDVGRLLLVTEDFPARDGGTYSDQPTLDLISSVRLLAGEHAAGDSRRRPNRREVDAIGGTGAAHIQTGGGGGVIVAAAFTDG